MKVSLIAAVAENRVIGKDNDLIWSLPDDMRFFKETTMGHYIIMGRRNFESMPRALPKRINVVITRNEKYEAPGAIVVPTIEQALEVARNGGEEEAFIIGGGEIYKQTMDLADKLYITHVKANPEGDTWFPEIDESLWDLTCGEEHAQDERHAHSFVICTYERKTGF